MAESTRRIIKDEFRKYDAAKTGMIGREELHKVLLSLDQTLSAKIIDGALNALKPTGLDEVSFDDFVDQMFPMEARQDSQMPSSPSPRRVPSKTEDITRAIIISDPGQDLDDEMMYIMVRYLVAEGFMDLLAIIATLTPAIDRARLCKGTLSLLGLHNVAVGLGTDGGDMKGVHKAETFEKFAKSYMPARHATVFEPSRQLLHRLYGQAEPKSLTLIITASLKDAALFLREAENLFQSKTREVVIMGGVQPWEASDKECILKPDDAHNQAFDMKASEFFYERCQRLGVPLVVVSRFAAYAAKVPRSCYDELASSGSWVGCRLRNGQRSGIESLWNRACGSGEEREGLPARCDRAWFLKTFCNGVSAVGRRRGNTIWDLLSGFMQYDTMAVLAAVPALRKRFFAPNFVNGLNGTQHMVIGMSETVHNVTNPSELAPFLHSGFVKGLSKNHQRRVQFILVTQPKGANRCDELMACVVLRTLYALGVLDCIGIVFSPEGSTDEHTAENTAEQAQELIHTLKLLGLSHVGVHVAETTTKASGKRSAADVLGWLYDEAVSPAGVSLIVTGSLTTAAEFAETHPTTFQQKTQSVIIMGGAFPGPERTADGEPTGQTVLVPDEAAQNNRTDMPAANRFYKAAQELLVPLVILSRYCSAALCLPRVVIDHLAECGGTMGTILQEKQKTGLEQLWADSNSSKVASTDKANPKVLTRQTSRLGRRCSGNWFADTMCGGIEPNLQEEDGVWKAVLHFRVYNLLQVLCALPPFLNKYINPTVVTVRSVRHILIGVTAEDHGVKDENGLRELIYQCLFSGCLLNESKFDIDPPTGIEVCPGRTWDHDPQLHALDWLRPDTPGGQALWAHQGMSPAEFVRQYNS